jgi:uncharacterized SAM-binding protein YcdF (DUF218 family)
MYEIAKLGGYLLSPLTLAMLLWLLAALCLALRRRVLAVADASIAFAGLWVASMPVVAQALTRALEAPYPALIVEATPTADAIVVLGGALVGASPPQRPTFGMGPAASRVWHAAALYRAGKAKWIVIAAGGQPEFEGQQIEADAIAEMLAVLGVPDSAMRRETASRNTRENAANSRVILDRLGARRVLLVTSAEHMPRAVRTFQEVWAAKGGAPELVPAPTDVIAPEGGHISLFSWFPAVGALERVTKALKEFAGIAVMTMMGNVTL